MERVLAERDGGIITLRLNRPDKLNALDLPLCDALLALLREVAEEASVHVVVITGAGRGFCSGGDIRYLMELRQKNDVTTLRGLLEGGRDLVLALGRMPKPVLASINGPAAGAGVNLALACDMRLASDQATFGETFARLGLVPDWGGLFFLPRLVGPAQAAEMVFTGRMINAEEAARIGLVNRVVPHERLQSETRALAQELAKSAPGAIARTKRAWFETIESELARMLEREIAAQMDSFQSQETLEGLQSFLEKRESQFRGS